MSRLRPSALRTKGRRSAARGRGRARFELGAAPREQPRRELGRPLRRIAMAALLVALLGGGGYGASWLLLGDTLRVRDVTVVGAQITDPHTVAAAASVGGESMLTLNTATVAQRVSALPRVSGATVHRDWPRGLIIDVTEHQGWGYWQASGSRRLIDIDGQVLVQARPPAADAPTIIEVGPPLESGTGMAPDPDTVRLVAHLLDEGAFDLLRVRPEAFVFRRDRGLTVLVDGGPHAVFGDSHNYEFKLTAWGALLDRIEAQRLQVREIDLRFGRRLVLR